MLDQPGALLLPHHAADGRSGRRSSESASPAARALGRRRYGRPRRGQRRIHFRAGTSGRRRLLSGPLNIHQEAVQGPLRADYYDNEGHVIRHTVTSEGKPIRFLGDVSKGAPRFRLTYTLTGPDTVRIQFEMAPPGKPEALTPCIDETARRGR